jgi:WD40 repeat protein
MAVSPDGEAVVTGAADETLCFWNVFRKLLSQKVSVLILFTGKKYFLISHIF